jgi:hypothetical protein
MFPQYDEFGRPIKNVISPSAMQLPTIDQALQRQPVATAPGTTGPDFSPVNIQPAQPLPSEQVRQGIQPLDPNDPQYKNSRLRTVLNAIASGLAGAAGGSKAGIETADALTNAKFNRAQQQQNRILQLATMQGDVEKEQIARAEKAAQLGIQRGKEQAASTVKTEDQARKERETENRVNNTASLVESRTARAKGLQDKLNQLPPELRTAMAISQMDEDQQMNIAKAYLIAHPKSQENTASKTQEKINVESDEENLKKISKTAAARGFASTQGRTEASGTQEAVDIKERLAEAQAKGSNKGRLEELTTDFGIKATKDIARSLAEARSEGNTLTSNIKDTMEAAKHGLTHLPRIYAQIDQMERDDKLGPIMSKWSDFMAGTVGTDEEAARLRFNIGLMDTLLAKAHGGARGGGNPTMMKHFADLLSSKNMNAKTLRGTLQEAEIWLKEYAKHPEWNDTIKPNKRPDDDAFWNGLVVRDKK